MPTYSIHAITVGSFPLGESDKIVSLFSAERGMVRAVAKGARKPGTKIAGRAEVLNINKLLMAKGRSLDIITQAEGIETFNSLRRDLVRLSYSLYYAELTQHFGQGLEEESAIYFDYLCEALMLQANKTADPLLLCLEFELGLLDLLGYRPELDVCVACRAPLTDYTLSIFHYDFGGIVCERCVSGSQRVAEPSAATNRHQRTHITPLVWKRLVLTGQRHALEQETSNTNTNTNVQRANQAARRIIQSYIEHKAGCRMKALDLIGQL